MKKLFIQLLAISLFLSGCSQVNPKEEQAKFDEFIQEEFVESMESNYINMHTFFENPKKFGIEEKPDVTVGEPLNNETLREIREDIKESKKEFSKFHRDSLNKNQKVIYDSYQYMLDVNESLSNQKFDDLSIVFSSMSGIHTQLPTLFTDFTIRNEQDIKDEIQLMKSVRPYIKSLLEYTKRQETKGTLMLDIDAVVEYCENVIDHRENSGILVGLNESVDALDIPDSQKESYKQQIKDVFMADFIPSYEDIVDTMSKLDHTKNNEQGLCQLKNGRSYYELLFKQTTGTDRSIKDIKKQLAADAIQSIQEVQGMISSNPRLFEQYANNEFLTNYDSYESILKDLENDFQQDFPKVNKIEYSINPISKDIASDGVVAYFNLPPIDDTGKKQIRMNTLEDTLNMQDVSTFTTVAHEGIPGHMYQTAYLYENMSTPWQKTESDFLGYVEGYATYVELYSVKYLENLTERQMKFIQDIKVIENSVIALLDIGIHYDGWDYNEASNFMDSMGMVMSQELYKQIQSNPTAFLPYYVGYSELNRFKEKAMKELGSGFEEKEFHKAILKDGIVPFSIVEMNVDKYIKNNV